MFHLSINTKAFKEMSMVTSFWSTNYNREYIKKSKVTLNRKIYPNNSKSAKVLKMRE
jgi:hypothetical protein